jgi:DNA adenine methylase
LGRYHEVFVGGGALFFGMSQFDLKPKGARLTDLNAELIACYSSIRDDVEDVIQALRKHKYDKDHFYEVRDLEPAKLRPAERAARMIFLNKTAFNGLYRVNSRGRFNVPFGRHSNPMICDAENLRACSLALADAELEVADFSKVTEHAEPRDFVYFDPPYVPVSDTSYFTAYSPGGFGWEDQQRLAETFRKLAKAKVKVMLSNSDTPEVRKLYKDKSFRIVSVEATRRINSVVDGRGKIAEVLVLSY